MSARQYWICVVSLDRVRTAVAGGFVMLRRGSASPLERMRPGDGFALYSPRETDPKGPPLQQFTAIGKVRNAPMERTDGPDGEPVFRRPADYLPAEPADMRALVPELVFIRSKVHWGAPLRNGFLPIPERDFARIAGAMGRPFALDFPPERAPPAFAST
jgi:hypothetical protein